MPWFEITMAAQSTMIAPSTTSEARNAVTACLLPELARYRQRLTLRPVVAWPAAAHSSVDKPARPAVLTHMRRVKQAPVHRQPHAA